MLYRLPIRSAPCSSSVTHTILRRGISALSSEPLTVSQEPASYGGYIRILKLNQPQTRNALSRQLVFDLRQQISQIESEGNGGSTRALIIASSSDQAFCAGADLKERKGFTKNETLSFLSLLRQTLRELFELRIPTITSISSYALGGGLELALSSSLRVFGSEAVVGLPETRLAIIPGAGGTYRLPSLIGLNRARDIILTGRQIKAPEAYFMGLCDRLVEITPEEQGQENVAREKVLRVALDLAQEICEGGPIAIAQAMKAVHNWQQGDVAENEAYRIVLQSDDRHEALRAFAGKRKPVFTGK